MGSPNPNIRNELIAMATLLEGGVTLSSVSGLMNVGLNTVRARRTILVRLGVCMSTTMLHGRGYGTPLYKLQDSLEDAKAKIDAKYSLKRERKPKEKKVYERDSSVRAGRFKGYGIESWFFITKPRADAYKDWCEPWTE